VTAKFELSITDDQLLTICKEVSSAVGGRGHRLCVINAIAQIVDADSREDSFELSATMTRILVLWSARSKASPLPVFVRDVMNQWSTTTYIGRGFTS
tara:strand:+ start:489 stop:779 length:291 start_codon:yes stop_codon:yes gene_type:complete